jgi:ferredoxin-NADP reductase
MTPGITMTPGIKVRLDAIRREDEGITSYELRSPNGSSLQPFTAGAHIDLHLPEGLTCPELRHVRSSGLTQSFNWSNL